MGRGPGVRGASESSIQIDFRFKGVRCRERVGLPPTEPNKKYVKRLKAAIEHEIATNTFVYEKHFPESRRAHRFKQVGGTRHLREAVRQYIKSLEEQLEPETLDEYSRASELVVAGIGPQKAIGSITRADFRKWVGSLKISKKRIDNMLIATRGMFDEAVEDGEIPASPLSGFKVRRVAAAEDDIDPFTPAELGKLAKQSLGDLWSFWAWSGMRTGEIIGLTRDRVGGDCRNVSIEKAVRVGREKGPKTISGRRRIELLPAARSALAQVMAQSTEPNVFANPNTGKRWHGDQALRRAFKKDCTAAKVRYRYPYQLRHTFASWALSSGENPAWAAKYMGHKDLVTFFRKYARWMPTLDPTAGAKMAKAGKSKAALGQRRA